MSRASDRVAGPMRNWVRAVALGGWGYYAAAETLLRALLADPATPRPVAAHAAVALASHRRQQGGHLLARTLDARALRMATESPDPVAHGDPARSDRDVAGRSTRPLTSIDDPLGAGVDASAARVDALVGLAADAVGRFDAATAARMLDVAADHGVASWRPRVRLGWVRAELALVSGVAGRAVAPAEEALDLAVGGGSGRHEVKSRLVLAVARLAAGGDPAGAVEDLREVAAEAADRGFLPLVWPALLAAGDAAERPRWPGVIESLRSVRGGTKRAARGSEGVVPGDARRAAAEVIATISQVSGPVGRRLTASAGLAVSREPLRSLLHSDLHHPYDPNRLAQPACSDGT